MKITSLVPFKVTNFRLAKACIVGGIATLICTAIAVPVASLGSSLNYERQRTDKLEKTISDLNIHNLDIDSMDKQVIEYQDGLHKGILNGRKHLENILSDGKAKIASLNEEILKIEKEHHMYTSAIKEADKQLTVQLKKQANISRQNKTLQDINDYLRQKVWDYQKKAYAPRNQYQKGLGIH